MPEVFDHFFRMLGTTAEEQLDLVPLVPAYRVYTQNHPEPLEIVSGRAEARALFESVEPGAGAKLDAYLDSAADAYELSVTRFLYDSYESTAALRSPEMLKRMPQLAPLLTRTLAGYIDKRFTDPRLRQVLGYPAVFLGGSPYGVPSLYHLMSHLDLDEGVLYPRGGFTEHHRGDRPPGRAAGVADPDRAPRSRRSRPTRAATPARPAAASKAKATGVRLTDGRALTADIVVSAADLHHTETALLPRELQTYPEEWWAKREPSPGALLLLLGVEGELPQLAHHTLLFAEDWRSNFDDIFGREPPRSRSRVHLRLPPERDRPDRRAGRAREPLRAGARSRRHLARAWRRRRRRRRRGRGGRRPRDRADLGLVRHPRPRRPHRRAPHDRARRLPVRPARMARQRPRPRAHAAPERGLPAPQRLEEGRRARTTPAHPRCPASGCRCA